MSGQRTIWQPATDWVAPTRTSHAASDRLDTEMMEEHRENDLFSMANRRGLAFVGSWGYAMPNHTVSANRWHPGR